MALSFIKKVFSFGSKKVEEKPAEDEALKPIDWSALEQLRGGEALPPRETATIEAAAPAVAVPPAEPEPPTPEAEQPSPEPADIAAAEPEPSVPAEPLVLHAPPEPEPEPEPEPADDERGEVSTPDVAVQADVADDIEADAVAAEIDLAVADAIAEAVADDLTLDALDDLAGDEATSGESPVAETPPASAAAELAQAAPTPAPLSEEPPRPAAVSAAPEIVPPPPPLSLAPPAAPAGRVTVGKAVEQRVEAVPAPATPAPRASWFQRLRDGLSRSSRELSGSIAGIFTRRKLDEETLQDLEDVLIRADLGVETALRVTDALASGRYGREVSDTEVRTIMAQEVEKVLIPVAQPLELDLSHKPHVILVVGVNGTGKTTTIGKLAAKLSDGGLKVMLAAGDTFRAAAIEQLKIWGERTGSPVVATKLGADAAGLAYDAFEKAKEAGSDVLIIDTAGRLQNKAELMAELEKIVRVLGKLDPEAPHTVLQTVDATTGQNALNQVEIFRNVAGVNGLVMTKLDGTARGGILVAIAAKHKLPVYFIGVGEQVDDLEPFSAGDFAKAIAGVG